jgi:hypothetical protein
MCVNGLRKENKLTKRSPFIRLRSQEVGALWCYCTDYIRNVQRNEVVGLTWLNIWTSDAEVSHQTVTRPTGATWPNNTSPLRLVNCREVTKEFTGAKNTSLKVIHHKDRVALLVDSCYSYCVSGQYPSSCFYFKQYNVPCLRCNPLSWAQSIELVPISRHQHQHKMGCINQTQHKTSARVKTNIKNIKKNSTHMRPSSYVHALFHGNCC